MEFPLIQLTTLARLVNFLQLMHNLELTTAAINYAIRLDQLISDNIAYNKVEYMAVE